MSARFILGTHKCSKKLSSVSLRCFSVDLNDLRVTYEKEFQALPEHRASLALSQFLDETAKGQPPGRTIRPPKPPTNGYTHVMSNTQLKTCLDAMLATFCLHVESRMASLCGVGFYTIGPCGEEALSAAAHTFQEKDSVALHYRHLAVNLTRQLNERKDLSMNEILLERARGYVVSQLDSVTGGVHCSIGSDRRPGQVGGDFIVTSTLASQCPPAVGRALAYSLIGLGKAGGPLSFVTLGDGSVHNAHFWSAFHLARHARHKNIKCPVVFGISDNGLSISYKTSGYVKTLYNFDPLVPFFRANGNDLMDVFSATSEATKYSRTHSAPAVCHYEGLIRRFGHAATDRQSAYLDRDQITSFANVDVLESAIVQVVEVYNVLTYAEVRDRFEEIQAITRTGFDTAVLEDKVTRQGMMDRVSAAMIVVPLVANETPFTPVNKSGDKREVMRKLMNRIIMETLDEHNDVVYLGEDCRHGGYYVITEGVADKYSGQIFDFPPDETSLLGTAMGFSQLGLTPIVEIPYAKYLDCGADMFYEIALMHWLSAGKCKNGMIIRVQGFDRGLFGGNFHTHNTLQHIPPGVDVVCFSNGEDYVRGFRNAVLQAKAGRVVMLVDCTQLLNLRHLLGHDKKWERVYPSKHGDFPLMSFHQVRLHGSNPECKAKWGIVTYGNGVVTALQARGVLSGSKQFSQDDIDVIDCPYLSETPDGLKEISMGYSGLLFADICKTGPGSNVLANTIVSLQGEGKLPERWEHVAAPRTYNPLGSTSTFLNTEDIVSGIIRLADK